MAKFKELLNKIGGFANKNAPALLTGAAVGGVVATVFAAGKAGVKIHYILMEHRESIDSIERQMGGNSIDSGSDALDKAKKAITKETVKEFIPAVLPPVVIGGLTIASIISANRVTSARYATLSAAYSIASASLKDHKEAIEAIVPKKADEIKENIITKHIKGSEVSDEDKELYSSSGKQPCSDIYTKVQFRSTKPEIQMVMTNLAQRMINDINGYCSLYDLYFDLKVPSENIPAFAHTVGWHVDDIIGGSLPVVIATCWDKTETIPLIGIDTSTAHENFEEGGQGSNSFRDEW